MQQGLLGIRSVAGCRELLKRRGLAIAATFMREQRLLERAQALWQTITRWALKKGKAYLYMISDLIEVAKEA
jgi:hypothetical protein